MARYFNFDESHFDENLQSQTIFVSLEIKYTYEHKKMCTLRHGTY